MRCNYEAEKKKSRAKLGDSLGKYSMSQITMPWSDFSKVKSSCVSILRVGWKTTNLTLQVSRAAIIRVVLQLLHSSSNIFILPLLLGVVANLLNVVPVIVVEPDTNVWFSSNHRGGAIWYWRGRSCVKQATNLTKKVEQYSFTLPRILCSQYSKLDCFEETSLLESSHLTKRRQRWSTWCRRTLWSDLSHNHHYWILP